MVSRLAAPLKERAIRDRPPRQHSYFKYRSDKSESKTAVGDNEPTAVKMTLECQNILFLNQKKNLAFIGTAGYSANKAAGKSLTFNRYDVSTMMLFPLPYEFTGVGGLAYYHAYYPDKTPSTRSDNNLTLNMNVIRPLNDWLNLTIGGSYANNQSNLEANTYNKYTIMTVLAANWSL